MKVSIGRLNVENGKAEFIENEAFCNEVYQVAVTDHPAAMRGVAKVVGTTGKIGNLCLIREHGLRDAEIPLVLAAVKEWQSI